MNAAIKQQMANALQQQATMNAPTTKPTSTNWQANTWNNMQQQGTNICPPAFQMNATQNSNQNNRTNSQKNPFRNYENQNYCWTHGHHIEDDHTSATCTMPDPGQPAATKMNTMG